MVDAAFGRVAGDISGHPQQLPKHPAALRVEAVQLVEAGQIFGERLVVPPIAIMQATR
jgi:hypothetical protein